MKETTATGRRSRTRSRAGLLLLPALLLSPLAGCAPTAAPERPTAAAGFTAGDPAGGVPAVAQHGMVVSASALASEVGAQVLREGGNAIDAAIATGFALAVTYPTAGNIGGGGFMVIRFADGRTTTFDFREKAPLAADSMMFVDSTGEYSYDIHHRSHLAVGVPGTVAGFALAHERYGSSEWSSLVEPAVALARDGFQLPQGLARSLAGVLDNMAPYAASVQQFSRDGTPYREGELFRQPDLGRTLQRIADHGRDGFYRGETARLIAEDMRRNGGIITERDLELYQAQERAPIRGSYRGYDVIGMPPPSSGGIAVVEMLNILEGYELAEMGHNSPAYLHHLAEAMRRAFRDRAQYVADTDFFDVPIDRLTSKEYAAGLRRTIDPQRATPSSVEDLVADAESEHTTHYSVVDAEGNAVSVTYTLEQGYGSKITVPGAGFLLNNEMGDFNAKPGLTTETGLIGTRPNLARPQQRMLSSMTPTILERDGRLFAVIGSPGGRTIINTVLQVVLNVIEFDMNVQEAVNAPRIHHQWLPDVLRIEEAGGDPALVRALEAMGHEVSARGRQGTAHSIVVLPDGAISGAPDPRDADAGAAGY
ncbi:MAG TPA: gamma-glutamyltransferase [Longimicrobiales bacterium]|nr:gamma-glutamyltransferase [Longimicrobiales bacterium]